MVPAFATSSFSTSPSSSAAAVSYDHAHGAVKAPSGVSTGDSIIPFSNIQAQWETMSEEERSVVHQQLEELQAKDWRSLSLDEKRAGQSGFPPPSRFFVSSSFGFGSL